MQAPNEVGSLTLICGRANAARWATAAAVLAHLHVVVGIVVRVRLTSEDALTVAEPSSIPLGQPARVEGGGGRAAPGRRAAVAPDELGVGPLRFVLERGHERGPRLARRDVTLGRQAPNSEQLVGEGGGYVHVRVQAAVQALVVLLLVAAAVVAAVAAAAVVGVGCRRGKRFAGKSS